MAGDVQVDGLPAAKPGMAIAREAAIMVRPQPQHVGRGALKLAGALDALGLDPALRVAIDVGASTGGFTQILLERGAARVYAVDVGRAQLHERLRLLPRRSEAPLDECPVEPFARRRHARLATITRASCASTSAQPPNGARHKSASSRRASALARDAARPWTRT